MWKSQIDVRDILVKTPDLDLLDDAFALSRFWKNAVYPEGYSAHESWVDIVALREPAVPLLKIIAGYNHDLPTADAHLAIFSRFFRHDLLIDWQTSDLKAIRQLLTREIREERIRFPFRFGRLLYDRFNDTDSVGLTEHLNASAVATLLAGTPHGVYQINQLLIGPLGVLRSAETRFLPPSLSVPLWHCSDTGCSALHTVELGRNGIPWVEAYEHAEIEIETHLGPSSEWYSQLAFRSDNEKYPDGRKYYDMCVVIAECIIGRERTALLSRALRSSDGDLLRSALLSANQVQRSKSQSPEALAAELPPESQLQLLLLLAHPTFWGGGIESSFSLVV